MNPHYSAYVELGKALAQEKGLQWEMDLDDTGAARDGIGWNLTAIASDVPPPTHYLRDLGLDVKALAIVNAERAERGLPLRMRQPLTAAWQDLVKAAVAEQLLFKRNTTGYVTQSIARPLRVIATCIDKEPWQLTVDDLRLSVRTGKAVIMLGEKASTVAKLIKGGRASGPIVEAFRRIQATEGDTAAYQYLRVEADGFHATPYGHCLSSFTVDPCPNHLECFNDCRHLSATDLPENRQNLIRLEGKLKIAVEEIKARPSTSVGWKNQLEHAEQRLVGVRTLLATPAGERPFPDGRDLSLPPQRGVLDD